MKSHSKIQEAPLRYLEIMSKIIAFAVCIGLMIASGYIVFDAFRALFHGDVNLAVQDGLFVLILLEMFYVIRSFIRHGSINVSIVISVGIIAAVKEMTFQLENMTLESAIAFGVIFITLGLTYFLELIYHQKITKNL